jgi:CheY-like chemotaxis protein
LPGSGSPTGPLTVLVVDDSKVVRIKTSRLLEKHGYQVLLADDGLAALACLDARAVDLVITDVEMPGLDGFGLTQRLRSQPRWTRLPVIMITSSDEKHRADAATVGVDVLLGKPYDEPALLAEVQHALGLAARRAGAGMVLQ